MKYSQYKFKFYLNASHAIYINGNLGQSHPHTWEIMIDTIKLNDRFIQFHEVERRIEQLLHNYQDKYINEIEPFNSLNPTLENICEFFKNSIRKLLKEVGWELIKIETSETPARSYIIDLMDEIELDVRLQEQEQIEIDREVEEVISKMLKKFKL